MGGWEAVAGNARGKRRDKSYEYKPEVGKQEKLAKFFMLSGKKFSQFTYFQLPVLKVVNHGHQSPLLPETKAAILHMFKVSLMMTTNHGHCPPLPPEKDFSHPVLNSYFMSLWRSMDIWSLWGILQKLCGMLDQASTSRDGATLFMRRERSFQQFQDSSTTSTCFFWMDY